MRSELKKTKGALGAFKLESKTCTIREYIGLVCKMYSLSIVDPANGDRPRKRKDDPVVDPTTGRYDKMTIKGVPKAVARKKSSHEQVKEILFAAGVADVAFNKLQSHSHQIYAIKTSRRMLTCFQDKAYQVSVLESRPLGHWRNIDKTQRDADARAAQEAAWQCLLDEDEDGVLWDGIDKAQRVSDVRAAQEASERELVESGRAARDAAAWEYLLDEDDDVL